MRLLMHIFLITCSTYIFLLGPAAAAMDLKSILMDVAKSDPSIAARAAGVDQADARVDEARAGYFPRIVANGAIERRKLMIGGDATADQTFTAKSLGADAKLGLFRGFQTKNSVLLRKEERSGSQYALRGTEAAILFDVVGAYAAVLRDRRIVESNAQQVELIRAQLKATQTRLARGEATKTDVSQAEARLAVSLAGRIGAQEALEVSESDFRRVVGQAPESLAPLPNIANVPASLDEAQLLALAENPSLAAAKSNVKAAEHGVGFSKGFLLPSIDAIAGVDFLAGGVANLFTGALPEDRKAVYGGVQAEVPIFQGGSEYAGIRRAKAFLAQRKSELVAEERRIADLVAQSWAQWSGARSTIEAAQSAVAANERAAEGVRRESISGNRTILDVLDANRELLEARVALDRAVHNEYLARAGLSGAVGRLRPENFASVQ
jgi:outer membrane protein